MTTNIAIACQGGGSHTAFTAGVLEHLFENWDDEHELVGISGTSGGAFNALAAWYGLVTGDEAKAAALVNSIWKDLAAKEYSDKLANAWFQTYQRLQNAGFPVAQISPYQNPGSELGKEKIAEILERHIEFDDIPGYCRRTAPELVVGTVDINAGVFDTFVNEDVTVEAVLASAAVPSLFKAVEVDGNLHWDGLFSQNPPVKDLLHQPPDRKPDELWVIQINPQELEGEPKTLEEIADRRNELSGNISLNQELRFVEQVNQWIDDGKLSPDDFSQPEIHRIQMGKRYDYSTKTDRSPEFIDELLDRGRSQAAAFLTQRDSS